MRRLLRSRVPARTRVRASSHEPRPRMPEVAHGKAWAGVEGVRAGQARAPARFETRDHRFLKLSWGQPIDAVDGRGRPISAASVLRRPEELAALPEEPARPPCRPHIRLHGILAVGRPWAE